VRPALLVLCTGGADHADAKEIFRATVVLRSGKPPVLVAIQVPVRAGQQGQPIEPQRGRGGHLTYDLRCPSCPRNLRKRAEKLAELVAQRQALRPGVTWRVDLAKGRGSA
jgi:hypothetical protein